jgi:hypothetical protein
MGELYFCIEIFGEDFNNFDLCEVCALPVAKFLKETKLVTKPIINNYDIANQTAEQVS